MGKRFFLGSLCVLSIAILITGCRTINPSTEPMNVAMEESSAPAVTIPSFIPKPFNLSLFQSKIDTFVIVLDASNSMGKLYGGISKFKIATTVVQRLNRTLPELGQIAGLRTVGHHDEISSNLTEMFYGMDAYRTSHMDAGLQKVYKTGSWSPMSTALGALKKDFRIYAENKNAVIFITDGLNMKGTIKAAHSLKKAYGDNICFYPILIGDAQEGRERMAEISKIGGCGFISSAVDILGSQGMADFVENVFLDKIAMAQGDTDKDGVLDNEDECPGTPLGAKVTPHGCWTLSNVLFDFDKYFIKKDAQPLLEEVVNILEQSPGMKVEIQGHTDNIGGSDYNIALSKKRAQAVVDFLVEKGIAEERLSSAGFGYTQPIALNGNPHGRALNRRVEIHPLDQ